jgi:anti-sigma regulatory factor (Ser/Thr protein kinase)
VIEILSQVDFPESHLKRLETAVAEATMNAMEHGNHYDPEKMVDISVVSDKDRVTVRITDRGGGAPIPSSTSPDLEAKLAGEQSPRGWGLFLIKNMVDEMNLLPEEGKHTIELIFKLGGS